jgi:membrane associated rhomboid family serine protease
MREPGEVVSAAFPRPGRALKAVLIAIAVCSIVGAIVWNWAPGQPMGREIFRWVAFQPHELVHRPWMVWTLVTSGVLTSPESFSHALWSLVGLYFLTTDLEKKWGGARMLRFLAVSVVMGNLLVLLVDQLLKNVQQPIFHPGMTMGPMAAITATAIAWSKENASRQIRLFFFLPISGKTLFWITIGFAVLALLFMQGAPEGAAAPFGGIVAGLLFGGTPSRVRSAWLRVKLALLRRKGHTLTVESITGADRPRAPKRASKGGPPLRVVQGGLDEDLKNRKPPKDKRYLN